MKAWLNYFEHNRRNRRAIPWDRPLEIPPHVREPLIRALHDGLSDPTLREVCSQILYDEEGHLGFHVDYLQRAFTSRSLLARILFRAGWRVLFRAVCLVVILDHRAILSATGISSAIFWWDSGLIFDGIAAGIFSSAPIPA